MSDFSVVFCGKCSSLLVDSGYDTPSNLKCTECNNDKEFKIGKVKILSSVTPSLENIIAQAKNDAGI